MKIYWSNRDIPEYVSLSRADRQHAWNVCYRKYAFKHWQTWVSLGVIGLLVSLGGSYGGAVGGAIGGGLGGAIYGLTLTNVLRPHLLDYLDRYQQQLASLSNNPQFDNLDNAA